ncbi:hypothetical protein EWM64_g4059 [Hericium alpestre]|uniref:Uncharacterized protein n=1 Tax=Hericium alpestre TaxID=135208 RepID=A0A4Y9ZYP9_9AGAM|nr:hypothetical protein EWM64_g4059 [Hericium alpestre]
MPTSPASSTDTISVAHCDAALAAAPADQKSVTSGQASTSAETAPWALQLSSSFTSIADQLAVASQVLSQVPASSPAHSTQPHNDSAQSASPTALAAFASRLDTIEQMQASLSAEINKIKAAALDQKGSEIQTERTTAASVEDLDKKITALQESLKLDQDRLYARLHNTTANVSKMSIIAPPCGEWEATVKFPGYEGRV